MSYIDPEVESDIGLSQDRSKFCMLQVSHLFIMTDPKHARQDRRTGKTVSMIKYHLFVTMI